MQIDINTITNGSYDGNIVYICDYRQERGKKPLRNVPPTKVKVLPKTESNKTVYYSQSFFRPYGKNGLLSKTIMPYDNTGFRSFTGNPVYVFDDHQECIDKWNSLIDEHIQYWEKEKLVAVQHIEDRIVNFKDMLQ